MSLWAAFLRWVRRTTDKALAERDELSALLKSVYAGYRVNAFPALTPLLAGMKKSRPRSLFMGPPVYWDVVVAR